MERYGTGHYPRLRPVTLQGYLITIVFAVFATLVSLFFANGDLGLVNVAAWIAIVAAATFLFVTTAIRMSARTGPPRRKRR